MQLLKMKLSLFGVCQLVLAFNFGKFPNYLPKRTFETINAEKASQGSDIEIAKEALISRLEVKEDEFKFVRIDHGKNDVTYLYANRFIDGIKVSNEVASVVIKNGRLLAVSNTFSSSKKAPIGSQSRGFEISLGDAVSKAELEIGAKRDDYPASKVYLTGPDNNLKYCHQFQLRDQEKGIFCRVAVEIATGNVLQVIDYGMSFSINAVKFEDLDVSKGLSLLGNEVDKFASPLGWNSIGVDQSFSDTQGNNGISQHDGRLEDGGPNLDFDSEFNPEIEPSEPQNIRASVINAFYTINKLHDIFYHFGFTESAGNFQQTNFDKGGKGNDSVIVYIQPNTRKNNARFYTPPDGQRGELYLYLFDSSTPMRDSALEQLIIIHEFGHGVSKRLTGGSDSPDCTFAYTQNCLSEAWR